MIAKSPPRWVVQNEERLILTVKGNFARYPNDAGGAKFYSTPNRAIKYGLRGANGTTYLVPANCRITIFGNIIHPNGWVERLRG